MKETRAQQRARLAQDYTVDPYSEDITKTELLELRQRLAKRANSRLARVRKYREEVGEEKSSSLPVETAEMYLGDQGRGYFSTSLKGASYLETDRSGEEPSADLMLEVAVLQNFLRPETSTVKGIKAGYAAVEKSIKDSTGLNIDVDRNLLNLLNDMYYRSLAYVYGSDQILDLIERAQKAGMDPADVLRRAFEAVAVKNTAGKFEPLTFGRGENQHESKSLFRIREDASINDIYEVIGIDLSAKNKRDQATIMRRQWQYEREHGQRRTII